jgi:hypothetical protein
MIAPLAKFIDWSAIQMLVRMPHANGGSPQLEEALQFLKAPDFITDNSQPAQVTFDPHSARAGRFRFPTPRPCEVAENNIAYGRFYPLPERWQERPVVVLLHGGGNYALIAYRFLFPLIARRCNRAGFNAVALVAPYHFQRRPAQPGALSHTDYLRRATATAQAVAEIRALTGWLLREGCPAVALWGSSYGGGWQAWQPAVTRASPQSFWLNPAYARMYRSRNGSSCAAPGRRYKVRPLLAKYCARPH